MTKFALEYLTFSNLRKTKFLEIQASSGLNLITGPNGSGKTTILEAISLLGPGNGLRNSKLESLTNPQESPGFSIFAKTSAEFGNTAIGCEYRLAKKQVKINGKTPKNTGEIFKYLQVVPLTQEIFFEIIKSHTFRRNYLDKLFCNVHENLYEELRQYRHFTNERLKVLQIQNDNDWLDKIEEKLADLNIQIYKARLQSIKGLNDFSRLNENCPIHLHLSGSFENQFGEEIDRLKILSVLQNSRAIDKRFKRMSIGSHLTRIEIFDVKKRMNISKLSSGEQRSALYSTILAYLNFLKFERNLQPAILVDDFKAFLDVKNSIEFIENLRHLENQIWLTTDNHEIILTDKDKVISLV